MNYTILKNSSSRPFRCLRCNQKFDPILVNNGLPALFCVKCWNNYPAICHKILNKQKMRR